MVTYLGMMLLAYLPCQLTFNIGWIRILVINFEYKCYCESLKMEFLIKRERVTSEKLNKSFVNIYQENQTHNPQSSNYILCSNSIFDYRPARNLC